MDTTLVVIGMVLTVVINALVVAYFMGKKDQKLLDHEDRIKKVEREQSSNNELKLSIARIEADVKAIRGNPIFVDGTVNALIAVCAQQPQMADQVRVNTGEIQTLKAEMRMHLDKAK